MLTHSGSPSLDGVALLVVLRWPAGMNIAAGRSRAMAKWWYWTVYRCPDCGATRDEYDASAPWCDSGLSSCPIIDELCDECWEAHCIRDEQTAAEER